MTDRIAELEAQVTRLQDENDRLRRDLGLPLEQVDMFGAPPKAARNRSPAEKLYQRMQEARRDRCMEAGVEFIPDRWACQRQNKDLKTVVQASEKQREMFQEAFALYLSEDHLTKRPAWSLSYFMTGTVRSAYESRAMEASGVAAR
jgi:hypothetical protein